MNRFTVLKIATVGLILAALASLGSATILILNGHEVPDGVIALGSASIGAVATLMTTSARESRPDGADI